MTDSFDLERFVRAQDHGVYEMALAEVRRGRKTSHWMWYVFPQIAGLGMSSTSVRYAIASLAEAKAYLEHPILGPRLIQVTQAALQSGSRDAVAIFGGIDAQKLRSSLTLFARVGSADSCFAAALDRFYDGKPDQATLRLLGDPT